MRAESKESLTSMVGQLAADSKRLVVGEVRLGFIRLDEGARVAARALAGIAAAFVIAVIAASATTALFAMLIGDLAGALWIGCLITGVIELLAAALLLARGRATMSSPVNQLR